MGTAVPASGASVKQTIFMTVVTLMGVVGAFAVEPFWGVAVYYLFAVLRPQSLWEWTLPSFGWSGIVAWSTIVATGWALLNDDRHRTSVERRIDGEGVVGGGRAGGAIGAAGKLLFAHKAYLIFGVWISLTYVTAQNRDLAWPWFLEYLK